MRLRGRQTQFYIDIVYGVAFLAGFSYLMIYGMDARVAAFSGGLVLGYMFRVWENMIVYERVLEEQVADEAETQVAEEVDEQVADEVETQVAEEVDEQVADEVETRVQRDVELELVEQVSEIDEELANELADRLRSES